MARAKKPASVSDMIRSLLVILVPLIIITVLFTRLPGDTDQVKVVDWVPVLTTARAEAPYPVQAPAALPGDWRATQVSWVERGKPGLNGEASPRNFWQLAVLNADDKFLGLSQGDEQIDDLITQETRAGETDGQSTVNGQVWLRLISPDGRTRSLVWSQPEVTTIVSGDLPYEELDAYAGSLRAS